MHNRAYLSYLPEYMGRIREMRALAAVIDPLLQEAEAKNDYVLREGLIMTAGDLGLRMWEMILGTGGGNIEERRERLLSYLSGCAPYTLSAVEGALRAVCGTDNVRLNYGNIPYSLEVWLKPVVSSSRVQAERLLKRVLPANMVFEILTDNTTHDGLSGSTHNELAQFTHEQM